MKIVERMVRNHSARKPDTEIDTIIIHTTGPGSVDGAISWWNRPESSASAHYLIDKTGAIFSCVLDERKAWHAGESSFQGVPDVNQYSIGIELYGKGDEYPNPQIDSLVELTCDLMRRHPGIRMDRIAGHSDVALPKGRKVDPQNFPWAGYRAKVRWRLSELGL